MQLGEHFCKNAVCSAPMAGVTDKAFRLLAREMGCQVIWTEMISATALTYNNAKTFRLLDIEGEEQPIIVQLFGSEPKIMAEAAKIAVDRGARYLDINMGCPAPKIVKNCEGSALLQNLPLAGAVAEEVVAAVNVPVFVKFRLGWDAANLVGVELARRLENVGISALVVHGRTRNQFYSGKADWQAIAEIKQSVRIPVIGNGDVWEPQDAKNMLDITGCDGVMIGRGSLGNPWLFGRTACYLSSGEMPASPMPVEKIDMALRHLELLSSFKGERTAVQEMRKHAAWYIKGLREATKVRDSIMTVKTQVAMRDTLERYREFVVKGA